MVNKTLIFVISEIWFFVGLLIGWLIIWNVTGLDLFSWKGLALFVAVLFLIFLKPMKDSIDGVQGL